jgi:hypothetical protein
MKKNTPEKAGKMMNSASDCAVAISMGDPVCLCESVFGDDCRKELKEINKHEIIMKICEILGPCPSNISMAEKIFEKMKYTIANYVLHHEYNSPTGITAELLLWLDGKTNPRNVRKLDNFIKRYLK